MLPQSPFQTAKFYTHGIDKSGNAYIFDKTNGKMVYYGAQPGAVSMLNNIKMSGGVANFEGDQRVSNAVASVSPSSQGASGSASSGSTGGGSYTTTSGGGYSSGGSYSAPKVLDQAQIDALNSLLSGYDATREKARTKAALTRDASLKEKEAEMAQETGKYNTKRTTNLQDFAGTKTDTDINTRNTLENLMSSLSTMGLGGSRALSRQILDAANMANRKANATQASNAQSLDQAYNEYKAGNQNDIRKIQDQYGYDTGEAEKSWAQNRQNTLYKIADVYNNADRTGERQNFMNMGNDLNSIIANAAFVNPSYTGEKKVMATPELGSYTQDIAKYTTTGIGGEQPAGTNVPGNLAIRATTLTDKDLGVKKKLQGEETLGV